MSVCGNVYVFAGDLRGEKRTSDPLELESQAVVRHLPWGLRAELGSSRRGISTLNC